jgi:CBS domain-containing protein
MKASEIMSKEVVTCHVGDSVNRAAQLMWEHRCGCVPVLDDNERVVGILTDRDACMAAYTQGRSLAQIPVETAMTSPVKACEASAKIDEVLQAMMISRVHRLLVMDAEGRLEGLVSLDDIARAAAAWDGKSEIDLEQVALTLAEIARRTRPEPASEEVQPANVAEVIRNSVDALKTLRDEIRVDLNLAGKEMRDRWKRLENQVHVAEIRAAVARAPEAAASFDVVIESVRKFRSSLRKQETTPPR